MLYSADYNGRLERAIEIAIKLFFSSLLACNKGLSVELVFLNCPHSASSSQSSIVKLIYWWPAMLNIPEGRIKI